MQTWNKESEKELRKIELFIYIQCSKGKSMCVGLYIKSLVKKTIKESKSMKGKEICVSNLKNPYESFKVKNNPGVKQ